MAPQLLHLSSVRKSPLFDSRGDRLGRIEDLIVRLQDGDTYPPVSGALARVGQRDLFVPIDAIASLEPGGIHLVGQTLNLGRFERRPGEVLLARDVAGRHLINLVGARLVKAHDVELACQDGQWVVVGVDTSGRSLLRRLFPGSRAGAPSDTILDWSSIEPFVAHVPSAGLHIPYRQLARLHPAQIADLVEAASHDEGEEIIDVVGHDSELEADVFEELEPSHQLEFLRSRSDDQVAAILARMEPDDAADLLVELDQQRRLPVLGRLPPSKQAKIRSLLSYNPETAGGLMSPDFLALPASTPVAEALDRVRDPAVEPDSLSVVYVTDPDGHLTGTVSPVRLLRADPRSPLGEVAEPEAVILHPDGDIHEITRRMSDFNLNAVPVVDDEMRMIGQITVDDVLELLLPAGWRRDFGMSAPE